MRNLWSGVQTQVRLRCTCGHAQRNLPVHMYILQKNVHAKRGIEATPSAAHRYLVFLSINITNANFLFLFLFFTGETPYQCDLCGKRFIHHTSFKIHSLSHTGQKSYKCDICSLALLSVSHLKRHMRVHTGEKKYACSTCGKRFAERYNLASHQKLHEAPHAKKVKQT